MRVNLPVTNVEYLLKEGESIVSKTDLKGKITDVNRPFIEISGFAEEELIGTSHNIVRHPDMPPAAFEDLWSTLKRGKPWHGMVKNRCKNGDYYWVDAERCQVAAQEISELASSSEELAATAEEMSSQAAQLQQVMGFFKVGAAA